MNIRILLFLSIVTFVITGCSSSRVTASLSPEIPEASYTGKGTNAGPMLVGSLGAVGVGVGIAIDKGIAKDFDKQIEIHKAKYIKNISVLLKGYFPNAESFSLSRLEFTAVRNDENLVNTSLVIKVEENSAIDFVSIELEIIKFDDLKTSDAFWQHLEKKLKKGL
ncbi:MULTISPECIES: hypothetical protein [Pseudoalteromonas]|uniref:Lipoprotein n=1 Tax=Pseudoalteromonas obscura TaxID=3048491 RepID=A0ABT7ETE5_9GAMM|nr:MULTISPECIES: hypothetical protein [Pseudoalteromonas]MBQ4837101.1 hypothetical protein [Pseudoalteromonas luteoviolacea]MDK2598321.1 hypothetical protein [Pseudoalteromonas sp. P94(2023)]